MQRPKIQRALAAAVLTAGVLLVPATAAHATPSNCWSGPWDGSGSQSGWQAGCGKLTNPPHDEWRAVAICTRENNPNIHVQVPGPWVGGINAVSVAHCALNYYGSSGWYETRVRYP